MKNKLEQDSTLKDNYFLAAGSHITIEVEGGDNIRLYMNEEGKYCSIQYSCHQEGQLIKTKKTIDLPSGKECEEHQTELHTETGRVQLIFDHYHKKIS